MAGYVLEEEQRADKKTSWGDLLGPLIAIWIELLIQSVTGPYRDSPGERCGQSKLCPVCAVQESHRRD
ncbi:unnamed protein product [Fusarium graminearum]|nr:unnamed protein product [Fusarium graminearum]